MPCTLTQFEGKACTCSFKLVLMDRRYYGIAHMPLLLVWNWLNVPRLNVLRVLRDVIVCGGFFGGPRAGRGNKPCCNGVY